MTPLYCQISLLLIARDNCIKVNNAEWYNKHDDSLEQLQEFLPSGSGFDNGTHIDIDESKPDKIVLRFSYHHMNEEGCYTHWTDHVVKIVPNLAFRYDLKISGRNTNGIKDYFYDVLSCSLETAVSQDKNGQFVAS